MFLEGAMEGNSSFTRSISLLQMPTNLTVDKNEKKKKFDKTKRGDMVLES